VAPSQWPDIPQGERVRKLLIPLLGALVLQLGLVQAAMASGDDGTTTTTAGQTTTTTTTAGQTTTTAAGQTTTTAAGQTTTTTAGQTTTTAAGQTTTTAAGQTTTTAAGQTTTTAAGQTTTTAPAPEPQIGVFSRQPARGPVGTTIAVRSVTPCVPPQDATHPEVEVVMLNEHDLDQGTVTIDEVFPVGSDGTWSGSLTVPADAEVGEYFIVAACFASSSPTEEPFLIYQPQGFTVVAAAVSPPTPPVTPPSPPAVAVPGTPTFTG
jgi:hypothetical protein